MSFVRQRGDALKSILLQAAKLEEYFFAPIMDSMKKLMPKENSIRGRLRLWWAAKKGLAAGTKAHYEHNVAASGIDEIVSTDEELAALVRSRRHFVFRAVSRLLLIDAVLLGVLLFVALPIYLRVHSLILAAAGSAAVLLALSTPLYRIVERAVRAGINPTTKSRRARFRSISDRGPLGTTMDTPRTVGLRRFRRSCVRALIGYVGLEALTRLARERVYPSLLLPVPVFLALVSYVQARPLLDWEAGLIWSITHPPEHRRADGPSVRLSLP
jgi:hypothetical protein